MKILMLCPIFPYPPWDGDKIIAFHFLEHWKNCGHQVDLFCLTREKPASDSVSFVRGFCRRLEIEILRPRHWVSNAFSALILGKSWNVHLYRHGGFQKKIEAYLEEEIPRGLDGVFAYRLRMTPYARSAVKRVPVFAHWVDVLSHYYAKVAENAEVPWLRRLWAKREARVLPSQEKSFAEEVDGIGVVCRREKDVLKNIGVSPSRISILSNGLECSPGKTRDPYPPGVHPRLCFIGNFAYLPNQDGAFWFYREIWPAVRRAFPKAKWYLVGNIPGKAARVFAGDSSVVCTGPIEDVSAYVDHATCTVAPLRLAVGFQNKVVFSLARGTPVAATQAALGGLDVDIGEKGARTAEEFTRMLFSILRNPDRARSRLEHRARKIRSVYRWDKSAHFLEAFFRRKRKWRR